ncbi:MAG: TonB-dependent receptor plug domain-containing protein [Chitinivibrionales bacterium]|nr:TonB-dependent receptor plug domain-containing protein [Chitinivibrionales bacterium]
MLYGRSAVAFIFVVLTAAAHAAPPADTSAATAATDSAQTAAVESAQAASADSMPVAELDRVTVTARRVRNAVEQPLLESPALAPTMSVVDEDDISAQNASSVVDALEYVPGAWTESRGRKVKQFVSVRGQKYPYPEYAVDGVWQREFHELPYFFSALQVERLEVLRSSAALINGVSGLTGIINIVPKSYDSLGIALDASYGTFDTYRANIMHGATFGDLQYAAGVGGIQTDGPEGKNAGEQSVNYYGRAKWTHDDRLTVQANVFGLHGKRELARIEYPGDTANSNLGAAQRFDPHRALVSNARVMYRWSDRVSTSLLTYYTRRNHDFYANEDDTVPTTTDLDWEWGGNLIQAMSLFDDNVLRISFLYNNWVAPFGKRFYSGKKTAIQTLSAAVADEHTFGRVTVDLGIRWLKDYLDEYAMYNKDGSRIGGRRATLSPIEDEWRSSQWNGTLGLRYQVAPGITVNGHGAAGYVNPLPGSVNEEHEEVLPEKQFKLDAGGQLAHPRFGQLTGAAFYIFRNDGIAITSQWDSVFTGGDTLVLPLHENTDMITAGFEIETRTARFADAAEGFANVTYMSHRRTDGDSLVEDKEKPNLVAGGGLNLYLGNFDVHLYGKYVSEYESSRFALNRDTVDVGGFSTLDLSAGYTHTLSGGSTIRLFVAIDNLTDRRYSTVVGYPDFGREVSVGLQYRY